ncbi:MAG: GDP-mannose dehydrogenase, partial [Fimbriimonadales bacterium]
IEREIPHIREILREDAREVIQHAEVLVIGHLNPAAREVILAEHRESQVIIDLARALAPEALRGHYVGLYW